MNLQESIKRILKEEVEISQFLRRRIDFDNLDNIVDEAKVNNFREDLRITYSIKNTILSVLYKIMPEEDSITYDNEVYYEVWDELKLYITDRYYDELYKYFERRKQGLFTEGNDPKTGTGKKPEGSGRRLYTDENPKDTVSVKFRTKEDIVDTLNKDSFKSKPHKRQSQIINLIHQRVRAAYQNAKDPETKKRLKRGLDYIESEKEKSKEKTIKLQKQEQTEGELTEKCWKGYTQKGMKTMFGKRYPNCVKIKKK